MNTYNDTKYFDEMNRIRERLKNEEITYANARHMLLDLYGDWCYNRWLTKNELESKEKKNFVRSQMLRNAHDYGHPLLPVTPSEQAYKLITSI